MCQSSDPAACGRLSVAAEGATFRTRAAQRAGVVLQVRRRPFSADSLNRTDIDERARFGRIILLFTER